MFAFLFRFARRRLLIALLPTLIAAAAGAVRWLLDRRRPAAASASPPEDEPVSRPAAHTVSLHVTAVGARRDDALAALRNQLGERAVRDPDENGFLEVELEAETFDQAVAKLRDAVAAAGADEAFELGESSGRMHAQEA